jgi:glycosyltransferase involved in cell wall biosynthesis
MAIKQPILIIELMRKNILILAHSYGMQFLESCNQYTQIFDPLHYAVTVAFLIGEPDEIVRQKLSAENILYLDLPNGALRGLKISAIRKVLSLCRTHRYTMVICHRYKPAYIMLWVAQFCRVQALLFVMHAFGTVSSLPRKLIIALLRKKNMFFAGVSDATRNELRQNIWGVPPNQIVTLYNIIDYPLFEKKILSRESARERLNLSNDDFIFGHIGRLVKEKDQQNLIRAFAKIQPQCPDAKLVIIGEGKLEQELKQQVADLQLQNSVIFTGFIYDGFQLMRAFDTFVLTSTEEAFGRVSLEAMVAKLPLIATTVDGIPEVVGDTALLIEPRNLEQLAATMLKVYQISQNERHAWGEKGYRRMLEHFSMQRFQEIFWQSSISNLLKQD